MKTMLCFLPLLLLLAQIVSSKKVAEQNQKTPLKIVVLGDSYSSGTGNHDDILIDYIPPQGCGRSPSNWASRYADSLRDTFDVTFINRACSGAVIANIAEAPKRSFSLSSIDDLASLFTNKCEPESNLHPELFYKQDKKSSCSRFVKLQIDAIDPTVDLVLLTIGGNDANFAEVAMFCFFPSMRDANQCARALGKAEKAIDGYIHSELLDTFRKIRDRMTRDGEEEPRGKIVLVDYPFIVLDVDFTLTDEVINLSPVELTRKMGNQYKELQQKVVDQINKETTGGEFMVFFKMTKEIFDGHEVDPREGHVNPDAWIRTNGTTSITEAYHPNNLGHKALGNALAQEGSFGVAGGPAFNCTTVQPFLGSGYSGKVGKPISFKAFGSYDPYGYDITSYEWDFSNEGSFDTVTQEPFAVHTFNEPYKGYVAVRVTSKSGSAVAKAFVDVNEKGYNSQRE